YWSSQDVEQSQLFLREVLADSSLILDLQISSEIHQLLEEHLDVQAARVIGLDQLLELLHEVLASGVLGQHGFQFHAQQGPELLGLGAFASLIELLLEL